MPLSYRIYPQHNLVYVHCTGRVTVDETLAAFASYAAHRDCAPGQAQLVDLTEVTDYERDFTRIMALQAHQSDVFLASGSHPFLIFVAPTALSRTMAMAAVRSWQDLGAVVPLVLSRLSEALEVLSVKALTADGIHESVR
ncbi:hypothetical protein [Shimia sp.]|uniref:hypothetical protein n=1 Tax=Shimia sp. TaxID=1954381 RepID=UPI00356AE3FB